MSGRFAGWFPSPVAGAATPWARIEAELRRSLAAYDRPARGAGAAAVMAETLGRTREALLVVDNGLYVFAEVGDLQPVTCSLGLVPSHLDL